MTRNFFAAMALVLFIANQSHSVAAEESNSGRVPPIVPAASEIPVRGVAVFSIHQELQQCLKDAVALLDAGAGGALHARIGTAQTFFSQDLGYILRVDFTRDDVAPPLINRIVCWHTGQLIASRISTPALSPELSEKALAVPQVHPPQH